MGIEIFGRIVNSFLVSPVINLCAHIFKNSDNSLDNENNISVALDSENSVPDIDDNNEIIIGTNVEATADSEASDNSLEDDNNILVTLDSENSVSDTDESIGNYETTIGNNVEATTDNENYEAITPRALARILFFYDEITEPQTHVSVSSSDDSDLSFSTSETQAANNQSEVAGNTAGEMGFGFLKRLWS